jgi:hypothetical protein
MNLIQKLGLALLGPAGLTSAVTTVNAGKTPRELIAPNELSFLFKEQLTERLNRESVLAWVFELARSGSIDKFVKDLVSQPGTTSLTLRASLDHLVKSTSVADKLIDLAIAADQSGETSRLKRRSSVYQAVKALNLPLTETNAAVELAALLAKPGYNPGSR